MSVVAVAVWRSDWNVGDVGTYATRTASAAVDSARFRTVEWRQQHI